MKHTPGPWQIVKRENENSRHYIGGGRDYLFSIENPNWGMGGTVICKMVTGTDPAERDANAQTISLLPELLEALQALLDYHEGDYEEIPEVQQARAVMEKIATA